MGESLTVKGGSELREWKDDARADIDGNKIGF